MPHESEIVAAMDADDAGKRLAEWMERIFRACGRADLRFHRDQPATGKDWNDMLRSRRHGPALRNEFRRGYNRMTPTPPRTQGGDGISR
jgi:hypothetical protein